MPDSPHASLSPTTSPERESMRRAVLRDLDANTASAGGIADYTYTTPRPELDRMRRRVAVALEQASALPGDGDTAHEATQRLSAAGSTLESEAACRDLVAEDAVDETGELAYDLSDEIHAVTQMNLAKRVGYHDAKLADPGYLDATTFDHLGASVRYRQHLVAQQFDAYKRGLEVVPSEHTKTLFGERVHQELTAWVLSMQGGEPPGVGRADGRADWLAPNVAEHLVGQSEYVNHAVIEYRHSRHDRAAAAAHDLYPDHLPEHAQPEWDAAARVVDDAVDHSLGRPPAIDFRRNTPHQQNDALIAPGTPARDAYLEARAQAGAVGVALADPTMRRALILDRLQHEHTRIASLLPEGYDGDRKPAVWRVRARSEWQRHEKTARALEQNAEWQEQLHSELGPNSEHLTRQALALTDARDHILASTPELQRNAIEEELAREPEWLTQTLGPRPEQGAGRWQTLAGQLAANRMRFLVADDADPGIRPEQSGLAQQVAQFQAGTGLAQTLGLKPDIGFGM